MVKLKAIKEVVAYSSGKSTMRLPLQTYMSLFLPCSTECFIKKITIPVWDDTGSPATGKFTIVVTSDTGAQSTLKDLDIHDDAGCHGDITMTFEDSEMTVKSVVKVVFVMEYDDSSVLYLGQCVDGHAATVEGVVEEEFEFESMPRVAVVMPVHGVPRAYLREALRSVEEQSYPNWDLCLNVEEGDEASMSEVRASMSRAAGHAYLVAQGLRNEGISLPTNRAVGLASNTTDIYTFMDCDDVLDKNALLHVAKVFHDQPEVFLAYTDEDKLDQLGSACDAHYKPDFSMEMLESQNYPCHLTAIRRAGPLDCQFPGLFRKEYDGAQDHEMWLRCSSVVGEQAVAHIPRVLYHWRKRDGSTAAHGFNKAWAFEAGYRAVRDTVGASGNVYRGTHLGTYRVSRHMPWAHSRITVKVIIPTRNNSNMLWSCLHSIRGVHVLEKQVSVSVHVVDNGSLPPHVDFNMSALHENFSGLSDCIRDEGPFNWSRINNEAFRRCFPDGSVGKFDVVVFMNDDVEALDQWWLDDMLKRLWQDGVGVVGAKLLYPDMTIQHAGVVIGMGGVAGHPHKRMPDSQPGYFASPHVTRQMSAVTGACMAVRAEVFASLGGFEESLPKAFNDVDFCLRVRQAGHKIVYTPWARLIHHESASRGVDAGDDPVFVEAVRHMQEKWNCREYRDPFFNPNLKLSSEVIAPR